MPPKKSFDLYKPKQHESGKSARRNYLKRQSLGLREDPETVRFRQRRLAASQRAEEAREQEKKKAQLKEKRLEKEREKERREKEAKEKLIKEGKLDPDALLGKVSASQPRLNKFFGGAAIKPMPGETTERVGRVEEEVESGDEGRDCLSAEHGLEGNLKDDATEKAELLEDLDLPTEGDLNELLLSTRSSQSAPDSETLRADTIMELPKQQSQLSNLEDLSSFKKPSTQDQVDAQLSSEAQFDLSSNIEIFEDLTSQNDIMQPSSSVLRKRKAGEVDDDDDHPLPYQSNRLVFSQMSPSKVNIRAREKPNPLFLPESDLRSRPTDLLLGLCTQDFDFEVDDDQHVSDKENSQPSKATKISPPKSRLPPKSTSRSVTNSFEAALRKVTSSPVKQRHDGDTDTDYGDVSDIDKIDDFPQDDHSWIDKAALDDLPPTPSKSRTIKSVQSAPNLNTRYQKKPQNPASELNTSFSALDDADFLEAAQAIEQQVKTPTPQNRRMGRRLPWKEQSPGGSPVCRPATRQKRSFEDGWSSLEALASTFEHDF